MSLFHLSANFVHPVTPTLIKNLNQPEYMFGLMFAVMTITNFALSPFWGKINLYLNSGKTLFVCCCGYGIAQLGFACATTQGMILLVRVLAGIFVGYDAALHDMTTRGFRIYILSFLLCGFNIFGSSFFTALNNGLISALISFLRTLVFQIGAVLVLPLLFELDGIWWSVVAAELGSIALTAFFMVKYRKRYHYA